MGRVIGRAVVSLVLERDHHECQLRLSRGCTGVATVADHRANRGTGGSKVLNCPCCLVSACGICNGVKEDAEGDARERLIVDGLRVLKAATNAETHRRCQLTPTRLADGISYWLTCDGRRVRSDMATPF